jgi:glyoxylase-like metal-dependent hydrolase (beta-lactamase superfamily II)
LYASAGGRGGGAARLDVAVASPIDTLHLGRERVICAWEHDGLIVDPGPASTIPTVLAGLADRGVEPRAVLLTHIHLDHAGGTGRLLERFPGLPVYVHELGAPHLIDPGRLLASAARLYGEEMERLWGRVVPVPEANVVALSGGERVEGMEVLATPGHAGHHVVYLDGAGGAYVGDVAGVRIAPGGITVLPTPPPEIDLEAWRDSLARLRAAGPEQLRLTHFGAWEAREQLDAAEAALAWAAQRSRGAAPEAFSAALEERIAAQDPAAAESMRQAMPPEQVWAGLERYWRKRGAG